MRELFTALTSVVTSALLLNMLLPMAAHAGSGSLAKADGSLDFQVNFRYPPTPVQIEWPLTHFPSQPTDGQSPWPNVFTFCADVAVALIEFAR